MIKRILSASCFSLLLWLPPSLTSAQELEIYIPDSSTDTPEKVETDNILARCLATGLEEYCAGISFSKTGIKLESSGISEITLETFIIDLDDEGDTTTPKVTVKTDADPDQSTDTKNVKSAGIEIQFDFNSYTLRDDQLDKVSVLAMALADDINIGKHYAVVGHTDGRGSDAYNCELSKKRASTLTEVILLGGTKAKLTPIGVGETLLKDPEHPNHATNRRVSFGKLDEDAAVTINAFRSLCD